VKHRWVLEGSLVTIGAVAAVAAYVARDAPPAQPVLETPRPAYLGSSGCQGCHPGAYASWRDTFHRTMTRRPQDLDWDGTSSPKLPVKLSDRHFSFELTRQDGRVVAGGPDLHVAAQLLYEAGVRAKHDGSGAPTEASIERVLEGVAVAKRPLALVTGSHHYLAFWLENGQDRELRQLPFVYHLDEGKWAPRSQAFLEPPQAAPYIATWNSNCIQCHAVAGEPQETEWEDDAGALHVRFQTRVGELGIACEACHGPGRAHASRFRNPMRRAGWDDAPESAHPVNPEELDSAAASAICGQCHAYFVPADESAFWEIGYTRSYLPGETLDHSRQLLHPASAPEDGPALSRELGSIFWPDGTIRVGGREYSGLTMSACYEKGSGERKLGCLSCHSMHAGSRDDQLRSEVVEDADAPCRGCHETTPEHSGHPAKSIGASCVNCHMPKTTYALLKGIRSHSIRVPDPRRLDVPSACALCHMDRPPAWFAPAEPAKAADADTVGVGVRAALSGNAAERAIYAAALSSAETRQTVGDALTRSLLTVLALDPYHAVRRIAEQGLANLPPSTSNAPILDPALVQDLRSRRDERHIVISE
jgi:predicted CXXCH cytochrome family protein